MNKLQKPSNLIEQILLLLKPMGDVNYLITDDSLELKKEAHVFGKLVNDKIYLIGGNKSFQQINNNLLHTEDEFLKGAIPNMASHSRTNNFYIGFAVILNQKLLSL